MTRGWRGFISCLLSLFATAAWTQTPGSAENGGKIFARYCATCHGEKADGNGPAAWLHKPPPADLRVSRYSDQYKTLIIARGGAAMGRSPSMPPWGEELDPGQIRDLVVYLGSLKRIR